MRCGEELPSAILAMLPLVQAARVAEDTALATAAAATAASAAKKAREGPSLKSGIILLVACSAIFAFILFVPTRPGHSGSKGFLAAATIFWTGRGIVQIAEARAWKRQHTRKA